MRLFFLSYLSLILFFLPIYHANHAEEAMEKKRHVATDKKVIAIVEVEDNVQRFKQHVEAYYPAVEIIQVYSILLKAIAVKAEVRDLKKLEKEANVKGIYPTKAYVLKEPELSAGVQKQFFSISEEKQPNSINRTNFTGKGVKVGIIDTGISLSHPDLRKNYRGGFDLVDMDEYPEETTSEEGIETSHGTHVAGIIAADGLLKGVAPDAEIFAYRALGPGGIGTSIQVIAALEEAVKDGMDIINLSLGNMVNAPDYPTSKAVNEAVEQGVIVVIANGNTGPNDWTVGSPATAKAALSVGAYKGEEEVPLLVEPKSKKEIPLTVLPFTVPWQDRRDRQIVDDDYEGHFAGKIGLIALNEETFTEKVAMMQQQGIEAIIMFQEKSEDTVALLQLRDIKLKVPIALVSDEDGKWLKKHAANKDLFLKNERTTHRGTVAPFSSRGPVTVKWLLKPDILAPGVDIVSTVPGGYNVFNGTSMAAPHVAGALAVLKEAHPHWTNDELIEALKTTAKRVEAETGSLRPVEQGSGMLDIEAAMKTETIFLHPNISFGLFTKKRSESTVNVTLKNVSSKQKSYHFFVPKKVRGLTWQLPQSITLEPNETRTISISLTVQPLSLDPGLYEGWIHASDGEVDFYLPYIFVVDTADFNKVMGFSFHEKAFEDEKYTYEMYVTEKAKRIHIELFDPVTLLSHGTLMEWENVDVGHHEGEFWKRHISQRGYFYGVITIELESGETVYETTEVMLAEVG